MNPHIALPGVPPVRRWLDGTDHADVYVCPDCKTALEGLHCRKCCREYARQDGIPILLSGDPRFQPAREISKSYDAIYREHHNAWENQGRTPAFIDYFSSLLGQFPRRRFLEIGCGEGFLLSALAQDGKFAIDLSTRAIGAARTRARAQFSVALAEQLPFPDGHFDLVASVGVMEHFLDIREATREIARVLSPGGHYVALTHVHLALAEKLRHKLREYVFPVPRPLRLARWLKGKLSPPAYPRQVIQHKFTRRSGASSLEDSGLQVMDILHTGRDPELPLIGPWVIIYVAQKQGRAP
ncbi:MAG TPA: methyltransferase domain-containing protein [Burkholderiales bacterium]|nr:methyltransferase domain-containing protein [Burkholderiales bacterium]